MDLRAALIGLLLVLALAGCAPAAAPTPARGSPTPARAAASTEAPAASPSPPPQLDATVTVELSGGELRVGDTITATVAVRVNNPRACQYPLYEVALELEPSDSAALRLDSPARLGPPGPSPATFTLTAVAPGEVRLRGVAYGEQNCGNGWQWRYTSGQSAPVTVRTATGARPLPTRARRSDGVTCHGMRSYP